MTMGQSLSALGDYERQANARARAQQSVPSSTTPSMPVVSPPVTVAPILTTDYVVTQKGWEFYNNLANQTDTNKKLRSAITNVDLYHRGVSDTPPVISDQKTLVDAINKGYVEVASKPVVAPIVAATTVTAKGQDLTYKTTANAEDIAMKKVVDIFNLYKEGRISDPMKYISTSDYTKALNKGVITASQPTVAPIVGATTLTDKGRSFKESLLSSASAEDIAMKKVVTIVDQFNRGMIDDPLKSISVSDYNKAMNKGLITAATPSAASVLTTDLAVTTTGREAMSATSDISKSIKTLLTKFDQYHRGMTDVNPIGTLPAKDINEAISKGYLRNIVMPEGTKVTRRGTQYTPRATRAYRESKTATSFLD